jgi:acylphosphatase
MERGSMVEQRTFEIIVSGRVQGVGFRSCVRRIAGRLSVTGEVMNLPDGTVRVLATTDLIMAEKFVSMLYSCPRAVIRDIRQNDFPYIRFFDFQIRYPDTSIDSH